MTPNTTLEPPTPTGVVEADEGDVAEKKYTHLIAPDTREKRATWWRVWWVFLGVNGGARAMTRQEWSQRTDWQTVCARAAGRRKYNEWQRKFTNERRELVWTLLIAGGLDRWGLLSDIARELGCHRSTIMRDKRALLRSLV